MKHSRMTISHLAAPLFGASLSSESESESLSLSESESLSLSDPESESEELELLSSSLLSSSEVVTSSSSSLSEPAAQKRDACERTKQTSHVDSHMPSCPIATMIDEAVLSATLQLVACKQTAARDYLQTRKSNQKGLQTSDPHSQLPASP